MKRFAARYVYTLTSEAPLEDAFVEVDDDGTVLRVGVCPDPAKEDDFIEGAIVPGFVNAHCHIELSYMWKLFRKGTGMAGFIDQINALRDTCPPEEKKMAISSWMKVLWDRGVSAMADISNCADSFAIKAPSPLYTRTFLEVFGTEPEDCGQVMSSVRKLQEEAHSFGLDAAPTPHACYTMSPQLLTASSADALKEGFLSFHSEETPQEEEMMLTGTGAMADNRRAAGMSLPPVTGTSSLRYFLDRLAEIHPAPFAEHILLVHEVCMDREGMDAVKAELSGGFVALCPLSNLFIHNMLPPVEEMSCAGLRLCIGTDSLSSNDDLNPVAEIFCLQQHFPSIPLGRMLGWACRGGAEFLGKEDVLGTLEEGKRPGVVVIDNLGPDGLLTASSNSRRLV